MRWHFRVRLPFRIRRLAPSPSKSPVAKPSSAGGDQLLREVRLGLVMNGGVSLAVWIGGVTHEIDCIRRAREAGEEERAARPTTARYKELLEILRERVVVDVIAGASAGGINGGLLAAATYAQEPLPALREVWLTVGDFRKLLRSPSKPQPPSILRGDEFVLPQLEDRFREILGGCTGGPNHRLYLYVTATDFHGVPETFADSTFRRFQELDHRRVFQFQHLPRDDEAARLETEAVFAKAQELEPKTSQGIPQVGAFDRADAANLLAHAARSSSSFPVAFEAHGMTMEGEAAKRWLIDGGILDNQPFNPVLNRIATIPGGDLPIRRVLGYIVPYVTEVRPTPPGEDDGQPTAKQTADAANSLPRDLPLLVDLERVRTELADRRRFGRSQKHLDDLDTADLATAAEALFKTYRKTRFEDGIQTFAYWTSPTFEAGAGEIGQLEVTDPKSVWAEEAPPANPGTIRAGLRWLPDDRVWDRQKPWHWGLSPSERIANDALVRLRQRMWANADDEAVVNAKKTASSLVAKIRALKFRTCVTFRTTPETDTLVERADQAYQEAVDVLTEGFKSLADQLDALPSSQGEGQLDVLPLQCLIDAEVLQNSLTVDRPTAPADYDFIHMSAGIRNALDHPDRSPEAKLAGMKLNHFAGFLKRSWRASDWMWGRLDGAQYLVSSVFDRKLLEKLPPGSAALREFAFPPGPSDTLHEAWARTLCWIRSEAGPYGPFHAQISAVLAGLDSSEPEDQFSELLTKALDEDGIPEAQVRSALIDCCRAALSARIQLEILAEELPEVAQAIGEDLDAGASRASSGAEWVRRSTGTTAAERVERFHRLTIGKDESPVDEASSKLGMEVGSTAIAVAAAAFSGAKGGLPAAVRAPLASLRGLTLVLSIIVRLLVRTPVVGMAAVIAAAVAVVWALAQPNTLLGAALPGLAAVAIGGLVVLITMATSPLEARCRGLKQGLGLLAIVAVPVALLLFVLRLPFGLGDVWGFKSIPVHAGGASHWLVERTGRTAVDVAGCFALAAFAAAVVRLSGGYLPRKVRVIDLWIYRWCLLLGAATIGGGAAYIHSQGDGGSWSGTVLFLILFGAISLAPLVAAIVDAGRWLLNLLASVSRT